MKLISQLFKKFKCTDTLEISTVWVMFFITHLRSFIEHRFYFFGNKNFT